MFTVGTIVGTHGLKGEVKVKRLTDFEERFHAGSTVYMIREGKELAYTIERFRTHKNLDMLQFKGINSIDDVEKLRGVSLYVKEVQQTPLGENEYYYHEIIGCKVHTTEGEVLGIITSILSPGANDVWIVETGAGEEILIPYIEQVVREVDPAKQEVIIKVMEGLIE